jgi:hypothetical protein
MMMTIKFIKVISKANATKAKHLGVIGLKMLQARSSLIKRK